MSEFTSDAKVMNRRGFLKGSALFAAAAVGLTALPAAAQQQQPAEKKEPEQPKKDEQPKKKELVDKNGREYRICDMCGGNMYKAENTWTCEQCGFSYSE